MNIPNEHEYREWQEQQQAAYQDWIDNPREIRVREIAAGCFLVMVDGRIWLTANYKGSQRWELEWDPRVKDPTQYEILMRMVVQMGALRAPPDN